MRTRLMILASCALASAAVGQTKPKGWWEQGLDAAQGVWREIERQGRPYAEQLAKRSEIPLKNLRKRGLEAVRQMRKLPANVDANELASKKTLLMELWRVRASIDIAALLQPGNLEALTDMHAEDLKALKTDFNAQWMRLFPKFGSSKRVQS